MKKRLLAGFLSLVLVLSLLPTAALAGLETAAAGTESTASAKSVSTTGTGVAGVANVYTLADIKAATNDSSVTTIRLMNDIDVSKENYRFDSGGQGDAPIYCFNGLRSGVVFEGNGYTIYNLKSGIWRYNYGTVRNLNISIHDTDTDSLHLSDFGRAVYTHQIEYFGIAEVNKGTIENCNVTMRIDRKDQQSLYISGIAQVNCGTIRDCIADLKVDVTATTGDLPTVWQGGIARSSRENSLIDHCLVLGHFNALGSYNVSLSGIADLSTDTARCVDSAFAMDKAEVSCQDQYYFSPAFQTWTGSVAGTENCRVANDIPYQNIVANANSSKDPINESGIFSGGPGYTLASRASILKDWDTSQVPAETPPTDIPVHSDPNVIPDDYVPIYTMADLKKCQNGYYLLMNDIDASQEDIVYDGNGYNASSFAGRLFSGGVLNGNGHTIYNLRGALFEYNMGTICNLNVTLSNTDKDTDTFAPGKGLAGIALANANGAAEGLIENCTVTMTVNRTFGKLAGSLSIDGISSGGTIRNCIAKLGIYLDARSTSDSSHMIYVSGIGSGSNNSLVDHCLVLGNIGVMGSGLSSGKQPVAFNGISACTAQDSACALGSLTVTAKSSREKSYEYFTLSSGGTTLAGTSSIRNRVASDLKASYIFNEQTILSGKPTSQAGTYTLDTRANILKDWDLSVLPDPDTLLKTDFTRGTAEFHFMGNAEKTRTWQFDYDDNYFYGQEDGFGYDAALAKASLCLEMASFSAHVNSNWEKNLSADDYTRAENIRELYHTLGFDPETYQFVNYDTALTNSDDKVAYSMAMKYIQNPDGSTDTLIAVPIRGGGYGAEWASNFHVYPTYSDGGHQGFRAAAGKVLSGLGNYISKQEIKGDLKIWVVGFSRGAAVANLLGRLLNMTTPECASAVNGRDYSSSTVGGRHLSEEDIYVYTFATPAGASQKSADKYSDPNIFNIVSPVDLVPHVAPTAWGFTRYGTTLTLPAKNSDQLWNKFAEISGISGKKGIGEAQRLTINEFCRESFRISGNTPYVFNGVPYISIQQKVMDSLAKQLGKAQDADFSVITVFQLLFSAVRSDVTWGPTAALLLRLETIGLAHYPEHYLARLETDGLQDESDFDAISRTRSVRISAADGSETRNKNFQVSFLSAAGRSAGTYAAGVCTSGEVSVEMTDIGLIATFPAGADYTFTVSGADAGKLAMTVYAYDGEELEPARTMDWNSLPSKNGSTCTVYVPEEPYDDFYVKDAGGKDHYPDSDSESSLPFTDVPQGSFFYDAVRWAVDEGVTSGTTATTFSPYRGCTRGQVVTFLWRAAGCPEPRSSRNPFVDVPANSFCHDAVLWAAEEGITTGVTADRFQPNATVTRGQVVTFLWRWDGSPTAQKTSGFRDVAASSFCAEAVSWAVAQGVTKGTTATTFAPSQTCTRGQIVTFLYRDLFPAADYED